MNLNLPTTRIKIFIAKVLYKLITPFIGKKSRIISRNGINFEVDLSEGIDLSLFLFGNFQKHVTNSKHLILPNNAQIFDIGGNFGVMSLQFAKKFEGCQVIAFEPTHYAISKFRRNLELNPELNTQISIVNSFVSDKTTPNAQIKAFSSWKVSNEKQSSEMHPVHLGTCKSTDGVGSITLDEYCLQNSIEKLDFIKIDTDGHEFEVFRGSKNCISKYKPKIIFEIGKYVMKEKGIDFNFYLDYFNDLNYQLINSNTNKTISSSNWESLIPSLGTIDIIAIPR